MEDLNVSGMMKSKHLSKAVQQQGFYALCSCCGKIKKDLKLSNRIHKCECGNIIDRDFQASLNLKIYGENVLKQESVA